MLTFPIERCLYPDMFAEPSHLSIMQHLIPEQEYASNTSCFLDGMQLGWGVNGVTGQIMPSALASTVAIQHSQPSEQPASVFKPIIDIADLRDPDIARFSSSLTFPNITSTPREIRIGNKYEIAPSRVDLAHQSVMFILLHWEIQEGHEELADPNLNTVASDDLQRDNTSFHDKYGHYFISKISRVKRFMAVW